MKIEISKRIQIWLLSIIKQFFFTNNLKYRKFKYRRFNNINLTNCQSHLILI